MILPILPVRYNEWPSDVWKTSLGRVMWKLPTLQNCQYHDIVGVTALIHRTSANTLGITHLRYLLSTGDDWHQEVHLEKALESQTDSKIILELTSVLQDLMFSQSYPEDMWGIEWSAEPKTPKDPREIFIMNGMVAILDTPTQRDVTVRTLQNRSRIFLPEQAGLSSHEYLRRRENNAFLHKFICYEIVNNFGEEFSLKDDPDMAAFAPF